MPAPVDLTLPEGQPAELGALATRLAGVAFHAGVLDAQLAGPAASAPGWLGADSAAAAEQVGRTAVLTRQLAEALTTAWHRLDAHHHLLTTTIADIRALKAAQDDDFAHVLRYVSPTSPVGAAAGLPAAAEAPMVEELRAAEQRRARQHAQLLDHVAKDAADASRVLIQSCKALGGAGAPGDGERVFVHLASELPGWGEGELSALGARLASRIERPITRHALDELVRDSLPYAVAPAFARALLIGLGQRGVAYLLASLGAEVETAPSPLAALLANVLGAALTGQPEVPPDADPLTEVFEGRYVDAQSEDSWPDKIVVGMGQVLVAGGSRMPPVTVAAWGRQMLGRERVQEMQGGVPNRPSGADPVVLVLECLGHAGDPGAAASLLASRTSWDALLQRTWDDGGAALSAVVATAVRAPTPAGGAALTAGLAALGAGLAPGSVDGWTVNRDTVTHLAAGLGLALAGHLDVLTTLLAAGLPFHDLDAMQDSALRGLGYLTIDEQAARTIADAVATWAESPLGTSSAGPLDLAPSVAIGSFVAVREYGQRLAYALHGAEEMYRAVDRQFSWDMTVRLPTDLAQGTVGKIAALLEPVAARHFRADGRWENGPDLGMVFNREDAAAMAAAVAESGGGTAVVDSMDQARTGFECTTAVLGIPRPPLPPARNPLDDLPAPPDPPEREHERPRLGRPSR